MLRHLCQLLCCRAIARRLCVAVTLLTYLATAIGFPLPASVANAAPAGHVCGQRVCCCGTVEQCKTSGCGCSHTVEESNTPSCCVKKEEPSATKRTAKPGVRWVLGMSARKCNGDGGTEWVSAHAALPGAMPLTWDPSWPFCHGVPLMHESVRIVTSDLLDPPPRSYAV
jgi:hypothetical protein